jgi:hypothetical protein
MFILGELKICTACARSTKLERKIVVILLYSSGKIWFEVVAMPTSQA